MVSPTDTMDEVRRVAEDSEAKTAVVVDASNRLVGWVSLQPGTEGPVGTHTEKFAAQVPLGTPLSRDGWW